MRGNSRTNFVKKSRLLSDLLCKLSVVLVTLLSPSCVSSFDSLSLFSASLSEDMIESSLRWAEPPRENYDERFWEPPADLSPSSIVLSSAAARFTGLANLSVLAPARGAIRFLEKSFMLPLPLPLPLPNLDEPCTKRWLLPDFP